MLIYHNSRNKNIYKIKTLPKIYRISLLKDISLTALDLIFFHLLINIHILLFKNL
jgi:hypothetical protein